MLGIVCGTPLHRYLPHVAVSATSVESLANHSLYNYAAVLRQYNVGDGEQRERGRVKRTVAQVDWSGIHRNISYVYLVGYTRHWWEQDRTMKLVGENLVWETHQIVGSIDNDAPLFTTQIINGCRHHYCCQPIYRHGFSPNVALHILYICM